MSDKEDDIPDYILLDKDTRKIQPVTPWEAFVSSLKLNNRITSLPEFAHLKSVWLTIRKGWNRAVQPSNIDLPDLVWESKMIFYRRGIFGPWDFVTSNTEDPPFDWDKGADVVRTLSKPIPYSRTHQSLTGSRKSLLVTRGTRAPNPRTPKKRSTLTCKRTREYQKYYRTFYLKRNFGS